VGRTPGTEAIRRRPRHAIIRAETEARGAYEADTRTIDPRSEDCNSAGTVTPRSASSTCLKATASFGYSSRSASSAMAWSAFSL